MRREPKDNYIRIGKIQMLVNDILNGEIEKPKHLDFNNVSFEDFMKTRDVEEELKEICFSLYQGHKNKGDLVVIHGYAQDLVKQVVSDEFLYTPDEKHEIHINTIKLIKMVIECGFKVGLKFPPPIPVNLDIEANKRVYDMLKQLYNS